MRSTPATDTDDTVDVKMKIVKLLISVNCKHNENNNYLKNDKLNKLKLPFRNQIIIEIIVEPEQKWKLRVIVTQGFKIILCIECPVVSLSLQRLLYRYLISMNV